jgi:soluble lytic murein transglycosylase-like protein
MRPRRRTWSITVVVGVAMAAVVPHAYANIYKVVDPATGVIYYTNAPSNQAAKMVIRELPRPMPVSALAPSRLPPDADKKNFDDLIREISRVYDVEYALVKAVIKAESGFNHRAVSPKGAGGLMQLMPATARERGVTDVFRPRDNIEGGVRHLKWLLDRYGGNVPYAVAAYNAGHARVEAAGGIPNIPETREYLARVIRYRDNYRREKPEKAKDKGPGVVFISGRR